MARPAALAYLAWRALVAHPLKKLFQHRGTGEARFLAHYAGAEGLHPTSAADREAAQAAAACISCGLCEAGCALAAADPSVRALGLHAAFRLYSRNLADLPAAKDALDACAGCAGCDALCPTQVPIARVVTTLRAMASRATGPAAVVSHGDA
ncbi:MAG: 4Fe-4S dicluster domain-containing protein [Anaeromyxobacter sp.]